MNLYRVNATAAMRTVRTTEMIVEAEGPEEAEDQVRSMLMVYPLAVDVTTVKRCVTVGPDYAVPDRIVVNVVQELKAMA